MPENQPTGPLSPQELKNIDAYWRAANYLSVGQIYLLDNPLLREPLAKQQIKPRLLGHWGTTPGLNFIYAHMNRAIKAYDLNAIYVCGPGHGGPGMVANTYLEGTYSEIYSYIPQTEDGIAGSSSNSHFPAASPATRRRKRPVRSMKAANSAMPSSMPTARSSTIPISSPAASWAMAKPKPAPAPPAGTPTNS